MPTSSNALGPAIDTKDASKVEETTPPNSSPTPPPDASGQQVDDFKAPTTGEDPPNEGIIVDCVDPQTLRLVPCGDNGKDNSEDKTQPAQAAPGKTTDESNREGVIIECGPGYYPVYGPDSFSAKDDKCVSQDERSQDEDASSQKGANKKKATTEPEDGKKDANEKDDPEIGISILCAPDYNLVKGSDPSGHEDKCVPVEDENIAADQAATIPESVKLARDHEILDEDGTVVEPCASGYYYLDGEVDFEPARVGPPRSHPLGDEDTIGDNDCVPEFISPCFNPEPGVITTQESVNDRSVGDGFTALGECAGDLVRVLGFVPFFFDEWTGEYLSAWGDEMGVWGWGLAWPMMATAEVSDLVADALSWSTWNVAEVIDDVSNRAGEAVDTVVDTVEEAWDSFTSCFGWC